MSSDIPAVAQQAVLVQSGKLPVEPREVKGYDFNRGVDHHALLQTYRTSGFQATNFGMAVEEISKMVSVIYALLIEVKSPSTKYHSNHSRQSGASISYHIILREFAMAFCLGKLQDNVRLKCRGGGRND